MKIIGTTVFIGCVLLIAALLLPPLLSKDVDESLL